ncbi:MAG TPA: LysR family transcriptional regulator [Bordetella sp.]
MQRINYPLSELRALVALHQTSSFIKAAQWQNITQSAFSRRIARLEEAVGGLLVERSTRHVALTALGRELVGRIGPLLEQLDDAMTVTGSKARGESGHIVVAVLISASHTIIPPALQRLRADYPGVGLHLRDDTNERVLQAVLSREAEFGVCAMAGYPPEITEQFCVEDAYVVAFPPRHPLAGRRESVSWRELQGLRVVGMSASNSNRQLIDQGLAAVGIAPPWVDEVEYLSSMLGLLQDGGAVGVLPGLAVGLSQAGKLRVLPLVAPRIGRRISLIRRADSSLSVVAAAFWDAVRAELLALPNIR